MGVSSQSVGHRDAFLIVVPGAGTGHLGKAALLFGAWWASGRMGGVGVLLHSGWIGWVQRHRFGMSKKGWWKGQGWLNIASLKVGLTFGDWGDRAGGRGDSNSTRGHCSLTTQPRKHSSALRRLFPKAFFQAKTSFSGDFVSHPPSCRSLSRCTHLRVHVECGTCWDLQRRKVFLCTQGWIYLALCFVVSLRADGDPEQSGIKTEGVCEAPTVIIVALSATGAGS